MGGHVCPWWGGYFIDNPLRRLLHKPEAIVGPYVAPGMTTLDVGCGMGLFSIAMAKLVGPQGRVIAADVQPKMLDAVRRRAERAGLAERIRTHLCPPDRLGVDAVVQFAIAFMMVHEVPDAARLIGEIREALAPGGKFFVAEPRIHVSGAHFQATLDLAAAAGLTQIEAPHVRWCRAAVFQRR